MLEGLNAEIYDYDAEKVEEEESSYLTLEKTFTPAVINISKISFMLSDNKNKATFNNKFYIIELLSCRHRVFPHSTDNILLSRSKRN